VTAVADRYHRRADEFEHTIEGVRPHQWTDQSPCERWTARDVVDHPRTAAPPVAEDPLAAFRAARADAEAVLADPVLRGVECDTPTGRTTVERHIDLVLSDDMVQHRWDLARATGQDDTIDPADVERLWASTRAIPAEVMERYRTPGAFGPGIEVLGPEVPVPEDAPLQRRLLGLIGRDPDWKPG
jgi:uncharacterized protein (TIGR03086 family)